VVSCSLEGGELSLDLFMEGAPLAG